MLFLAFQVGAHRYAIDASQVAEVLPLVAINAIARAPEEIAGVLVYRGAPVPVLDLSQLLEGRPAERRLSTRLVVVHYPVGKDVGKDAGKDVGKDAGKDVGKDSGKGETRLLALIAEKATETIRREALEFVDSGVVNDRTPYLGSVAPDTRGMVQRVDIGRLLTARHQTLFGQLEEQEWASPTSQTS
jgi:chemotaxis-related protein WspB